MNAVKKIFICSMLFMLAAFIIVLIFLGAYKLWITALQLTTFTKHNAVIVSCESKWSCSRTYNRSSEACGFSYYPVAQIGNGTTITGATGTPKFQCSKQINESVSVLVNPKNTSEGVIYTLVQFWLLPFFILLFFSIIGSIAIPLFKNYRRHNKAFHQTNCK